MTAFFVQRIVETGRLPMFCFFVAFVTGFVLIRISVRLIRAEVRWWPGNVTPGGLHIHHVVFGVALMLVGGVGRLMISDGAGWAVAVCACVFGLGAALVLDEFALILHLSDVYWTERGRTSVDAVFVAIAMAGLLLLGLRPFGYESLPPGTDPAAAWTSYALMAATVVFNLAMSVVTLLKGKIWTGIVGVFVPGLALVGAVRLAVPSSPWARWRYPAGSRKLARAHRRNLRIRRPLIRLKINLQEFIAGRHLPDPEGWPLRPSALRGGTRAAPRSRRVPPVPPRPDPPAAAPAAPLAAAPTIREAP
ncbi:hypothetical protein [Allonocardiopsis opalescens]|uniref:Integral membrane protein n=1 Tax=Allonocardiopsis opalescens TaxID=1144618 RepID=A0A2T0Q9K5_9ACTN|nr:hypothetical protein [Allonocardiopsis opalescens]PRY00576.1 hypothetical protein CLV72_102207 [Allonocardiopsis opalescens]